MRPHRPEFYLQTFDSRLLLHHIQAVSKMCYVNAIGCSFPQKSDTPFTIILYARSQHPCGSIRNEFSLNCETRPVNELYEHSLKAESAMRRMRCDKWKKNASTNTNELHCVWPRKRDETNASIGVRQPTLVLGRQQTNGAQCESAIRTEPVECIEGKKKYNI